VASDNNSTLVNTGSPSVFLIAVRLRVKIP